MIGKFLKVTGILMVFWTNFLIGLFLMWFVFCIPMMAREYGINEFLALAVYFILAISWVAAQVVFGNFLTKLPDVEQ